MLLVAGGLLVLLGLGNWTTGAVRTRPYLDYLQAHPGPRLQTQDLKAELLEPPDNERQERDVARAKLEFYQLVQSAGRLLVVIGAICLFGGWATRKVPRYSTLMPGEKELERSHG